MADSMLPQTIFAPRIAVIGADDDQAITETLDHAIDVRIDKFNTSNLSPSALLGVIIHAERNAGVV